MNHNKEVVRILSSKKGALKPVLPFDLTKTMPVLFDLSARSRELERIDPNDVEMFTNYVFARLRRRPSSVTDVELPDDLERIQGEEFRLCI